MHPRRGIFKNWHAYRSVPDRFPVMLLNLSGDEIARVSDAWDNSLTKQEAQAVAQLDQDVKWINLPRVLLPRGVEPQRGHRIREIDNGSLWEVRNVGSSDGSMTFTCYCVRMNQHDAEE